jgi:hypothetical protein
MASLIHASLQKLCMQFLSFIVNHRFLFLRGIHIIKLPITQFSPSLSYIFPCRHQHVSEHSLPEERQPLLFLKYERPCSIAMQNKLYSRIFASLCFEIANLRTMSTHKTNLTYISIYTQQMYKVFSYAFRYSTGALVKGFDSG